MSDILIKNIEMPKSCGECRLAVNAYGSQTEGKCAVLGYGVTYLRERHDACPLVALPEHGRLIEENKAYDSIMEQTANHYIDMDGVDLGLQNAPTVLEASKETD